MWQLCGAFVLGGIMGRCNPFLAGLFLVPRAGKGEMCLAGAAENHWYAQRKLFSAAFPAAWLERFILTPEPAKSPFFFPFFFPVYLEPDWRS